MIVRCALLALGFSLACSFGCGDDDEPAEIGPDGSVDAATPSGSLDAALAEAGAVGDASSTVEAGPGCVPSVQQVEVTSEQHVIGEVVYPSLPPAGGDHNGCWARWGVHETELADERFVHNLEHGGVVFLYRCPDGCPNEVAALKTFTTGRDFALLTPYAALPTRFGAVAWGHRLLSDCFDLAAFERFFIAHRDQARESITSNPPSTCN